MRAALVTRLKRLEAVRAVEAGDRRLKIEFAYLKLLRREYSDPATGSRWANGQMGGTSAKSGPAKRRPIKSGARARARTS